MRSTKVAPAQDMIFINVTKKPFDDKRVRQAFNHAIDTDLIIKRLVKDKAYRAVSWLPLYHDMGLIGFLMAPLSSQLSIDYLTPRDFARRPMQWLNIISKNRGTISYSPSFGYDLAVRRGVQQVPPDLDLSCWRHAGIGGDMIRPDVLDRFTAAFAAKGFSAKAFIPSYGMAEVCLAITFSPYGTGVRTDTIDRKALADELLFGKLTNGGKVVVDLDDADAVKLEFSENEAPPAPAQEEAEA